MMISSVRKNNVQSAPNFKAEGYFKPYISKAVSDLYSGTKVVQGINSIERKNFFCDEADRILRKVLGWVIEGAVTRSSSKPKRVAGYNDVTTFKHGDDTITLATAGESDVHSAIVIKHGKGGRQGETYLSEAGRNDDEFDNVAQALTRLEPKSKAAKNAPSGGLGRGYSSKNASTPWTREGEVLDVLVIKHEK